MDRKEIRIIYEMAAKNIFLAIKPLSRCYTTGANESAACAKISSKKAKRWTAGRIWCYMLCTLPKLIRLSCTAVLLLSGLTLLSCRSISETGQTILNAWVSSRTFPVKGCSHRMRRGALRTRVLWTLSLFSTISITTICEYARPNALVQENPNRFGWPARWALAFPGNPPRCLSNKISLSPNIFKAVSTVLLKHPVSSIHPPAFELSQGRRLQSSGRTSSTLRGV